MIALKIEDRKQFTSGLFVGDLFDGFLVKEASVVTFNAFTIDGRVRKGYYTMEEQEELGMEEYSTRICLAIVSLLSFSCGRRLTRRLTRRPVRSNYLRMYP